MKTTDLQLSGTPTAGVRVQPMVGLRPKQRCPGFGPVRQRKQSRAGELRWSMWLDVADSMKIPLSEADLREWYRQGYSVLAVHDAVNDFLRSKSEQPNIVLGHDSPEAEACK